jgi:hypothetical protein
MYLSCVTRNSDHYTTEVVTRGLNFPKSSEPTCIEVLQAEIYKLFNLLKHSRFCIASELYAGSSGSEYRWN